MGGVFITFEGVDGAGKSTQLRRAAERLQSAGHAVTASREPGGSPGAEEIRALLVSGEPGRWSVATELLLFTAARRDHLDRLIEPALAAGHIVLCDRYVDSTRAYQVAGRGAPAEQVEALHRLMVGREPDATLIFDVDPAEAARRRGADLEGARRAAEDRFERFGLDFQTRLRAAFAAIARDEPGRCTVIDADQGEAEVSNAVDAALHAALTALGSRR
ncbi:MAG: dTMP kinase [Pseudomonadota bacterium]